MMRTILALLFIFTSSYAVDRCVNYIQDVRKAHYSVFGVDYPYQYGVGQLVQESGCRNILSLDGVGSEGLSQITYRVWQKPLKQAGISGIKAIPDQLKAQAVIMKTLYLPQYGLWVTYQVYNGGGLVLKEIKRAGVEDWAKAYANCKRGQSCFTYKGKTTCKSNCEINYDYSQKIYKYGERYSNVQSEKFRYW